MRYLLTSLLCVFTLSLTAQVDCPNTYDGDEDGVIGISDLLGLLAVFGDTDSDYDGVFDSEDVCIDDTACNYQANPTQPCYYLDVLGVCGGICNEDADGDGICDFTCGLQTGHEGYNYSTVLIGEQCWFSENCRYLPSVSPGSEGNSTTDPYYFVYDYQGTDVEAAKATTNYETYGVLYNWPAVMTEGICPSGWHIPSDGEWQTMEMSLGMSEADASSTGWRGSPVGDYLKSTSGWSYGGNGSNSSGLNCLPGGQRYIDVFYYYGGIGCWWSSSESGSQSWKRVLDYDIDVVYRGSSGQGDGYSARCVGD
jgi:uncharacterized protein (TIGR02145 family)